MSSGDGAQRMPIRKTYKLYLGGKFPRSESGRSFKVLDRDGNWVANASRASRKDVRDAVAAARKAFPSWWVATAYNRGQVLYRVAEMLETRSSQFVAELAQLGMSEADARAEVEAAIDTWVYYAGFADKYAQVLGTANPVAGSYFNFSVPEPTGVVAVVAPQTSPLLGLARTVAPVIAAGNSCVVIASQQLPLSAISLGEVLATSDVPGGVVNILTGHTSELAPVLADHMDVNAIDLRGVDDDAAVRELRVAAVENLKRIIGRTEPVEPRDGAIGSLEAIAEAVELKTVWHPIGV